MPKQDKEGGILPPSMPLTAFAKKSGKPAFFDSRKRLANACDYCNFEYFISYA